MASLFDLKILFTQGGNSTSEVWDVQNKLWTSLLFTRTALEDEMNDLMSHIRPILRPDIIIKGATLSRAVAKGAKKGDARDILTFAYGEAGTRVLANNYVPTELALGLRFQKDSETPGMPGHWLLRGTLLQSEVKIGKDGFFVLADNFDMTAVHTFETAMTYEPDANFRLVLPAKGKDNYITGTRNIHKWECVGLGRKDLRNNRRTDKEKSDDDAIAQVGKLFREIASSIADGFQLSDIIQSGGYAIRVGQLIARFGGPTVSKLALRALGQAEYAAVAEAIPALAAIAIVA